MLRCCYTVCYSVKCCVVPVWWHLSSVRWHIEVSFRENWCWYGFLWEHFRRPKWKAIWVQTSFQRRLSVTINISNNISEVDEMNFILKFSFFKSFIWVQVIFQLQVLLLWLQTNDNCRTQVFVLSPFMHFNFIFFRLCKEWLIQKEVSLIVFLILLLCWFQIKHITKL